MAAGAGAVRPKERWRGSSGGAAAATQPRRREGTAGCGLAARLRLKRAAQAAMAPRQRSLGCLGRGAWAAEWGTPQSQH